MSKDGVPVDVTRMRNSYTVMIGGARAQWASVRLAWKNGAESTNVDAIGKAVAIANSLSNESTRIESKEQREHVFLEWKPSRD